MSSKSGHETYFWRSPAMRQVVGRMGSDWVTGEKKIMDLNEEGRGSGPQLMYPLFYSLITISTNHLSSLYVPLSDLSNSPPPV